LLRRILADKRKKAVEDVLISVVCRMEDGFLRPEKCKKFLTKGRSEMINRSIIEAALQRTVELAEK